MGVGVKVDVPVGSSVCVGMGEGIWLGVEEGVIEAVKEAIGRAVLGITFSGVAPNLQDAPAKIKISQIENNQKDFFGIHIDPIITIPTLALLYNLISPQ